MSRKLFHSGVMLIGACLAVCLFPTTLHIGDSFSWIASAQQSHPLDIKAELERDIVDEAPLSTDPTEQASRETKNRRYNLGGRDLMTLEPDSSIIVTGCGGVMPLLPTGSSPVIVSGTVIKAQPYLSEDHSTVYTEYLFRVEEYLKKDSSALPMANGMLVIDREGGRLRLQSGQVIRYDVSGTGMARPLQPGERCVLFLDRFHDDSDLRLGTGFLLRDGKAYLMQGRKGQEILAGEVLLNPVDELSEEAVFIQAVRRAIANPPSPQFYSELDLHPQQR